MKQKKKDAISIELIDKHSIFCHLQTIIYYSNSMLLTEFQIKNIFSKLSDSTPAIFNSLVMVIVACTLAIIPFTVDVNITLFPDNTYFINFV